MCGERAEGGVDGEGAVGVVWGDCWGDDDCFGWSVVVVGFWSIGCGGGLFRLFVFLLRKGQFGLYLIIISLICGCSF